uniref:Methionine aminopeptidase n=1 Tax=Ditylenchus dipsaci TaxID=166011 RepID=A0A915D6K3_9BILA
MSGGIQCEGKLCQSLECNKPAKLRCPTCIKSALPDAFFCSQDCFKSNWGLHKLAHITTNTSDVYNPWPNYRFSESIPRPDYVSHPEGVSLEERNSKNAGHIVVNTYEEQEGVRLASKLGREVLNEAAMAIAPGVTTDEIDRVVHEACIEGTSCCTSVNEVICHGIQTFDPCGMEIFATWM